MRFYLTVYLFFSSIQFAWTQEDFPTGDSYAEFYAKNNPGLQYRYDTISKTHDYSGNWDLDQDGVPDKLYFVGFGATFTYYFLRVVTSSNGKQHDFPYIVSIFPLLPDSIFTSAQNRPTVWTAFTVFEKTPDKTLGVFVKVIAPRPVLKKKGLRTDRIIVTFSRGHARTRDYKGWAENGSW